MNTFLRRGIKEHTRKNEMKRKFLEHNRKLARVVRNVNFSAPDAPYYLKDSDRRCSILLAPLIEIAWADGSVKTRELDAIFEAAETFGLTENEEIYAELLDMMLSRATPSQVADQWHKFHELWRYLEADERETVGFCMMMQARFVAEQSSNDLIPYLRGDRISFEEKEILRKILGELEMARRETESAEASAWTDEKKAVSARVAASFADENCNGKLNSDEIVELLPLVPLVKVAWAEGRITRRERELIFNAAERMGIEPGSISFQRLEDWLELHPTDDFYQASLERLRADWRNLPDEEQILRHLDLLSDCVNIAEASGGTSRYPAGGPRVCDEEIAAVKRIATKINARAGVAVI